MNKKDEQNCSGCSILVVAGGTGGHIVPGLALVDVFRKMGARAIFLTLKRNSSYPDIAMSLAEVRYYNAPSLKKSFSAFFLFPFHFLQAFFSARNLMGKESVNAVIGMGGYPTLPALMAAWSKKEFSEA